MNKIFFSFQAPKPLLQPVYDCQTETPIQGLDYPLKVQGLCGRIRQPPEILLEEEIVRMHTESGWQLGTTMARPDGPKAGDLVQVECFLFPRLRGILCRSSEHW